MLTAQVKKAVNFMIIIRFLRELLTFHVRKNSQLEISTPKLIKLDTKEATSFIGAKTSEMFQTALRDEISRGRKIFIRGCRETVISSTESDVNILQEEAWTVIDRLLFIWKYNLSDKVKRDFF